MATKGTPIIRIALDKEKIHIREEKKEGKTEIKGKTRKRACGPKEKLENVKKNKEGEEKYTEYKKSHLAKLYRI